MPRKFTASVIAASALALVPSAAFADPPPAEPIATTVEVQPAEPATPAAVDPATSADAQRYAQLESASPEAADFQGGSAGVYIGAGGAVVIILVVILVIVLV